MNLRQAVVSTRDRILRKFFPEVLKHRAELAYWRARKSDRGELDHDHYEWFYTEHFRLSRDYFVDKRILDIGCGPAGSLEWASMARERVGIDPLADDYMDLGAAKHKMTYIRGVSESIPFPDGYFDVVCSFNSIDHVSDLQQTIAEICRVTTGGGLFLLLTEVNHAPTVTEPIQFSWDILESFSGAFEIVEERHFEKTQEGMYQSVAEGVPYDHSNSERRHGVLSARLRRK